MKRMSKSLMLPNCSNDSPMRSPWISTPSGLLPIDLKKNQLYHGTSELLIKEVEKEANLVQVFVLKICTL